MCCHRRRSSKPLSGSSQPRTVTPSPALRSPSRCPASPRASTSTRRPSSLTRTSTLAVEAGPLGILGQPAPERHVVTRMDVAGERRHHQSVERALHHRRTEHRERHASVITTRAAGPVTIAAAATPATPAASASRAGTRAGRLAAENSRDQPSQHQERSDSDVCGHTVTSGASSENRLSPIPRTLRSSFTDVKPPRR